jgi:tripartite-type tricarboxylate transporter receptor subunit TctC
MKFPRRRFLHLAAGLAALPAVSRIARAQSYPSRPITFVVPAAAGGPTDNIMRVIAERMRAFLGQPIIMENNGAAGGTLAVGRVARAAPDGYTVGIGQHANYVLNGAIYPLQYDLLKDFAPVALLTTNPVLIVAKAATPAKDLKELIVWLKANPGKASAATAGAGSPSHVATVFFQNSIGTSFQFVPYRGNGPAMQDLVAGQIDVFFDSPGNSLAHVRAGRVKAYAVTAKTRIPSAPDIPTVDEAGAPGLYVSTWHGLWVPKATPKDVIARLNAAVVDALADATVHSRFADLALETFPREQQTPEALGAFQKAEIEKWWPIIKAAGIKAE